MTERRHEDDGALVLDRLRHLSRRTVWRQVAALALEFRTHHPQGMARVGNHLFVSSVEILRPTRRLVGPAIGHDRDPGEGIGHLFKVDTSGRLIAGIRLGEGDVYHPGGIDFDGRHLWVPVAEYRPRSRSIVYRVDPLTLASESVLCFEDHLGAVAVDRDASILHAMSWGGRERYAWPLDAGGRVVDERAAPVANPTHYVDYQDCRYLARHRMLASGVANYRHERQGPGFQLGGLELVDLATGSIELALPFEHWSPSGRPLTQNPVWIEASGQGLQGYFMPDDDQSTLFVLEADLAEAG